MKIIINRIIFSFCLFIWLLSPSETAAENKDVSNEIAVVVNPQNKVENLTSRQISDIFLARSRTFPSGEAVMVLEQKWNGALREKFFHLLNGMSLKRINAYWARLQFSGEIQPPPLMPNDIKMRDAVRKNRNAIGYMATEYVDESIRVILILRE
ncbi:MAG: hypothetical protein HQK62_12100 [Desulfamplus sp.]|nr:hypothetical protein [Desulfamplus sp.]